MFAISTRHIILPVFLLLAVLTGYGDNLSAQSSIPTNQEVLAGILASPALEVVSRTVPANANLVLRSSKVTPLSSWLVQILTDSCLQQKYLVYSPPEKDSVSAYWVEVGSSMANVAYSSAGRKWLLFSKGIYRQIEGTVHLQIRDRDGRVLFSEDIAGSYEDMISGDAIRRVENEELPFTKGSRKESTFRKRWLEPVLITATTATVIVLFYTLRSQ